MLSRNGEVAEATRGRPKAKRLALDLASLDVGSIASISGGDEIASLTSGHAVADMSASCCCETSSCCTCL
jgi:hypothetical protein